MTDTRQLAHDLIDKLQERQLTALVRFLETIVDPASSALRNAPIDDEPEPASDQLAAAEARDWLKNNVGKGVPKSEAIWCRG